MIIVLSVIKWNEQKKPPRAKGFKAFFARVGSSFHSFFRYGITSFLYYGLLSFILIFKFIVIIIYYIITLYFFYFPLGMAVSSLLTHFFLNATQSNVEKRKKNYTEL